MRDLIEYEKEKLTLDASYEPPFLFNENDEPVEAIDSIEQYFKYLPTLIELGGATASDKYTRLHSSGRRYTVLPIDEGIFDINANTRIITVPNEFKNGISVQGDELAEVLYFRIDRFYDATDLDTADIYIQWKAADGTTGVSTPWVVDIESQPNKIIFGWPISSAITGVAGNVEFAVRFYKTDGGDLSKLLYSFATLTQSAKVLNSLDFTLGDDTYITEYGIDDKISSRIVTSKTHVVGQGEAAEPLYLYNAEEDAADAKVGDGTDPTAKYAWYDAENHITYIDLTGTEVDALTDTNREYEALHVSAVSTDAGIISYKWTYLDIDTGLGTSDAAGTDGDVSGSKLSIEFFLTKDTAPVANKVYYQKDGNSDAYIPFDIAGLDSELEETPASKGLYEKFSQLKVYKVGKYHATAYNRKARANTATLDSDTFIVPMPIVPVISDPNNLNPDGNDYILYKGGDHGNTVTLSVNPDNTETVNHTHKGVLSYEWYHRNGNEGVPYVALENSPNSNELTLVFDANKEAQEVEGYYKVKVTNTKNGESVNVESKEARLSYPAEPATLAYPINDEQTKVNFNNVDRLGDLIKVIVTPSWLAQWNISDRITYQWYETYDEYPDQREYPIDEETGLPTIISSDDRMCNMEEDGNAGTNYNFVPNHAGKYFCVITNYKSSTDAITISPVFYVV